jgi:RNA polymerase-binding transcription factor DksA
VWAPNHPLARRDGYVFEHRKMAWDAGVLTDPTDQVHHVNETRDDNRLENFEIKDGAKHALDHVEERGYVINQFGTFAVRPREQRQAAQRAIRPCEGCGEQVPLTRRRDATFCTDNCRVRTWKRRHRG